MPGIPTRSRHHHGPDILAEELVALLSSDEWFGFQTIFDRVYGNLKKRNTVHENTERIRLRVYEKLHILVNKGMVTKTLMDGGKKYKGASSLSFTS